ncbi:MAG TPA: DUF2182 domain-containing protein [Candidatus Angelobacter sp.]|jgi:predicted metal-binding membrane protein|nr:DUF2182 domain-containing protein [Candidatus Angelobacter sp.]
MTYDAQQRARVRNPVLLISAVAWILLVVRPESISRFAHCPATSDEGVSFQMMLAMNPPASLAAGWVLMLAAMMSPVLMPPLCHIRARSFTHRRTRSIALFIAGYAAIWMVLGSVLLSLTLAVKSFASQSYLPAAGVAFIAFVWQFSPIKQRCLNRCHGYTPLATFGVAADFDALRFGISHGIWCAGSCWALMLLPMLLPQGHLVAMAIVTFWIFSERLEQPMPPRWRWRTRGKALRILVAQARIRMSNVRPGPMPFLPIS